MERRIVLEAEWSRIVNVAMQQNRQPMVQHLMVSNQGNMPAEDLRVSLHFAPGFAADWECRLERLPAGESLLLDTSAVRMLPDFLLTCTERIEGSAEMQVTSREGEALFCQTVSIAVLPYDQWGGSAMPLELSAAFITPNHPEVARILRNASEILQGWGEDPSFTAYHYKDPNLVRRQMAAIFGAIQKENIAYRYLPASFEACGQRVMLADSICTQKLGNCLDFSLLYCSCLEAASLHPILILEKEHARAGCWLEESCFPECVQDDGSALAKRARDGTGEIVLVECTYMSAGRNCTFTDAEECAQKLFEEGNFCCLVDICRARSGGVRPLSLQKTEVAAVPQLEPFVTDKPGVLDFAKKPLPQEAEPISRQQLWERRLLDLSLRNMLINFRITRNTLPIIAGDYSKLEDRLAGGAEYQILPRPEDWDSEQGEKSPPMKKLLASEMENGRLRTLVSDKETAEASKNLYRRARLSLEENGANTLFLAIGLLRWYETDRSEKARYAPLVMLPMEMVLKTGQSGYTVRLRDEEPQINITLLEMLRQDFKIQIGGLDPLPRDEDGIDLPGIFQIIRQAVMDRPRWDVEQKAYLGLFSFNQFIMWSDIRNRAEDLQRSPLVKSLLSGRLEWQPDAGFPMPGMLDELCKPADMAVPIAADASQLGAVYAAGQGKSFVLHGPPGTGKSQTITNIIANAVYQGKTVLFLAEKMAALSVVQKRLEKIGLGPFSLELHSNRARKQDVLAQLNRALEIGRLCPAEGYEAQAERLYAQRRELNDFAAAMYKKQPCGLSAWEAVIRCEQFQDAPADICFSSGEIAQLDADRMRRWEDLAEELKIAAQSCGGIWGHPLREFGLTGFSGAVRTAVAAEISALERILPELTGRMKEFCALTGIKPDGDPAYLQDAAALAELCFLEKEFPSRLLTDGKLEPLTDDFRTACDAGRHCDAAQAELSAKYHEQVFSLPAQELSLAWKEAGGQWLLPRMLRRHRVLKTLHAAARDRRSLRKEDAEAELEKIAGYQRQAGILAEKKRLFAERFGSYWGQQKPDWDRLEQLFRTGCRIQALAAGLMPENPQGLLDALGQNFLSGQNREPLLRPLVSLLRDACRQAEFLREQAKLRPYAGGMLGFLADGCGRWHSNLGMLRDWCGWTSAEQKAEAEGLGVLTGALRRGAVSPENMIEAFRRGLYAGCADYILEQEPVLGSFRGELFETKIRRFRRTSAEFEELTRRELAARLSARIPAYTDDVSDSSEIGILQKAIRSGGRKISIRRLFDSIPHLLPLLCPCMLMSPISVAQYIDPAHPPFDLIVFDEASQLPTCEAVGAIARAEHAVVVGDPRQLPPTSFFMNSRTEEDSFEQEDLESILDDCLALSMPQEHLLWHYRSRHESLIAFSNRQYYENRLYTFPSPNDLRSQVMLVPVEGSYDRGGTKQNRAEALAVVDEILRRMRDPALRGQSIGVVTFSAVQQELIEDLLMQEYAKDPALEEQNAASEEPLFIKNLENVQGDERDVILFSIGYGPDGEGKVALNFGPLNREGGWRRLNVAVSRARMEMKVFSTLRPEQIDLSKTRAEGVAGLRAFLEFAQNGPSALPIPQNQPEAVQQPFAEILAGHIRRMGYEVRTCIGCSGFKVDLAVVDPEEPGEYLLGVLCDGPFYASGKTARDRNLGQEGVLESLGWRLHRVWLLEWREDPMRELEKIRQAILQAAQKQPAPQEDKPLILPPVKTAPVEAGTESRPYSPYRCCILEICQDGSEQFMKGASTAVIRRQMREILETEAPVSADLISRKILTAWGIPRITPRIERRLAVLLGKLPGPVTRDGESVYYWGRTQKPETYAGFRVPGEDGFRREAEDIPPEETAAAVRYLLERQISLPRVELVREVSRLFGYMRGGAAITKKAEAAIDQVIGVGEAVGEGDRVVLVRPENS